MTAAWQAGRDYFMPMGYVDDALETEGLVQASLESSIPSSNRGYALLERMGWTAGKGLGRNEDGACIHSLHMASAFCPPSHLGSPSINHASHATLGATKLVEPFVA